MNSPQEAKPPVTRQCEVAPKIIITKKLYRCVRTQYFYYFCSSLDFDMKQEVAYNGLTFEPYISKEEIDARIKQLAQEIERDCAGTCPLFLCVLNGAFVFASDLFRAVDMDAGISFIRLQSYSGTGSTGVVKEIVGLTENIEGRTVIVVEDIVDSGNTIVELKNILSERGAAESRICTLLLKPDAYKKDIKIDYVAMEIPNDFIVGFGLDYDELGRNYKDIYVLDA